MHASIQPLTFDCKAESKIYAGSKRRRYAFVCNTNGRLMLPNFLVPHIVLRPSSSACSHFHSFPLFYCHLSESYLRSSLPSFSSFPLVGNRFCTRVPQTGPIPLKPSLDKLMTYMLPVSKGTQGINHCVCVMDWSLALLRQKFKFVKQADQPDCKERFVNRFLKRVAKHHPSR
jgi:hypothetical protein